MNNSITKKILQLGVVLIFFTLSACGLTNSNNVNEYSQLEQDAKNIIKGIESNNYELILDTFSPYVKNNYPALQSDICELLKYIDGDIVSYEGITSSSMGGHSTEDGWVEKKLEGEIYNVKTNQKKTYNIKFEGYYINEDNPEKGGVRYLSIECLDELDEDGYPIEKSIYYK